MTHKVEDHLKLVHKIAHRYSERNRMEHDDIFQEGCIGLMRACREYKEGKVPFLAFAAMYIQYAILNALKRSHFLHIDSRTIDIASKINKHGLRELPVAEIAEKLDMHLDLVEHALEFLKLEVMSLDFEYKKSDEKGEKTLLDHFGYEQNFDDHMYIEQMLDVFEVPERDKPIMRMVIDGHPIKEAAILRGENYKALQQRKSLRKKRMLDKKHLVYA